MDTLSREQFDLDAFRVLELRVRVLWGLSPITLVLKQASMERKRVPLDLGIFDSA